MGGGEVYHLHMVSVCFEHGLGGLVHRGFGHTLPNRHCILVVVHSAREQTLGGGGGKGGGGGVVGAGGGSRDVIGGAVGGGARGGVGYAREGN